MHRKDQDKLLARAEEMGWTVVDTDPFTLTKLGRTLRVSVNLGGMITGADWSGGPERTSIGSGTASVGRLLAWLDTDIVDDSAPPVEPVMEDFERMPWIPETELQAQKPPPPVIPQPLIDAGVTEVPAGVPMIPPEPVDEEPAAEVPPADVAPDVTSEPPKKTPAKKAPAKKVAAKKETTGAKDPEASSSVPG